MILLDGKLDLDDNLFAEDRPKTNDRIRMQMNQLIIAMSMYKYYYDKTKNILKSDIFLCDIFKAIYDAQMPRYNPEFKKPDCITYFQDGSYMYIDYDTLKPFVKKLKVLYNKHRLMKGGNDEKKTYSQNVCK